MSRSIIKYFTRKNEACEYYNSIQTKDQSYGFWSFEKSVNGSMRYLIGKYDDLLTMYLKVPDKFRFYHEVILDDDLPVKLFFDLDSPMSLDNKDIDIDCRLSLLHKYVGDMLHTTQLTPIVMDASDAIKYSKHVIYNFAFPNKAILNEFISDLMIEIKKNDDDLASVIDVQVYGKDHSLRMLGSNKRNANRPFIIHDNNFNRLALKNSLIKCVDESDFIITKWGIQDIERHGIQHSQYKSSEAAWVGWSKEELKKVTDTLVTFCKNKYDRSYIYPTWLGNMFLMNIRPGLYCPVNKGVHKSNSSSVMANIPLLKTKNTKIYIRAICLDADCDKCEIDKFTVVFKP